LYVGLARQRAVAVIDAVTDQVERRISLASLGRIGAAGQIVVGSMGSAAALPLLGSARDVAVITAGVTPRLSPAAHGQMLTPSPASSEAYEQVRVTSIPIAKPDEKGNRLTVRRQVAQSLAIDNKGTAYVLVGDPSASTPWSIAVVDTLSGALQRRLAVGAPGETAITLASQPDGSRLYVSVWRRETPSGVAHLSIDPGGHSRGTGKLIALDPQDGRTLAEIGAPQGQAFNQVVVALAPPTSVPAGIASAAGASSSSPNATTPNTVLRPSAVAAESDGARPGTLKAAGSMLYAVAGRPPVLGMDSVPGSRYGQRAHLHVVDPRALETVALWPLDEEPYALAVQPDGRHAYALAGIAPSWSWDRRLVGIDLSSGSTSSWTLPSGCLALAMSPTGKVYVSDTMGDRVWWLDTGSHTIGWFSLPGAPLALAARPV
jgi:hypothetical protein